MIRLDPAATNAKTPTAAAARFTCCRWVSSIAKRLTFTSVSVLLTLCGNKVGGPVIVLAGFSALVSNLSLVAVVGTTEIGVGWGAEGELKSQFVALLINFTGKPHRLVRGEA